MSIQNYFDQAQLALAAYGDLLPGALNSAENAAELVSDSVGMSAAQASVFAAKWNVVTQYTDPITGVSTTVFQAVTGGPKYLAIRGTQGLTDYLADYLILNGTPSTLNPQYQALKTQVQAWLGDGTLTPGFTVSGHSLGGYLAAGLVADFGSSISQAYLYNAPGNNSLVSEIAQALGFSSTPDAAKITSLRADAGISPIAGLGNDFAPPISITIENQFLSDVSNPPGSYNHSQRVLTDALALYAAYAQIDSTVSVTSITNILKASSNLNGNTLELALDNLRELLLGATVPGTVPEGRESYYTNLYQLTDWLDVRNQGGAPALKFDALTSYGGTTIASKAQAATPVGLAYRYALAGLNPFALTGDASIYTGHNTNGELDLYDPATGTGNLSDRYLKDRAAMLSWKMKYDTGAPDSDDPLTPRADKPYSEEWDSWSVRGDWDFIDQTSGIKLSIDGVGPNSLLPDSNHRIVFGSNASESLTGSSTTDHLYGGAGADTLTGKQGNDYLEGGAGNDFLLGGIGNDTYIFSAGDGTDTVLDTDGLGVVKFGTVEAKGSAGLDPAKWTHTAGTDTWTDRQNGITYTRSVVAGETQLLVHKGDSNVLVKGWSEGELGIVLGASTPSITPPAAGADIYALVGITAFGTETGDRMIGTGPDEGWNLFDARGGDDQIHVDGLVADPLALALAEDGVNDQIYSPNLVQNTAYGGAGNDLLLGGREFDRLYGGSGDDVIVGADGGDLLVGDQDAAAADDGDDVLYGGDGDDAIFGGGGADLIFAGTGDDTVIGNAGNDVIIGGLGADTLAGESIYETEPGLPYEDYLDGGEGNDELRGMNGADILLGGGGDDLLVGGIAIESTWKEAA